MADARSSTQQPANGPEQHFNWRSRGVIEARGWKLARSWSVIGAADDVEYRQQRGEIRIVMLRLH